MRKLIVTIELENSGCRNLGHAYDMLREAASKIADGARTWNKLIDGNAVGLMDVNGNKVGSIEIKEDDA